eukprot:scaffold424_cov165-Ochromonas_danica.AAC.13
MDDAKEGSPGGLMIPAGVITSPGEVLFHQEACYLLLDVAVGRSYVFDGNPTNTPIPPGYDSLYIPDQPLDRNRDGKFSLQEYQKAANFDFRSSSGYSHKYFVSDVNQVCPKYIVCFQIQKARQSRFPDVDGEDVLFVDPITLQPAEASPAVAATFDKRAVAIEAAYNQALTDVTKMKLDPSSTAKSAWIQKQLGVVEEKVRAINLNYAEVSEAIEEAAAQAQKRLQDLVRQKLELCLSMEIELRRQTEQVDWLDGVLGNEVQRIQSAITEAPTTAIKRKLMLRFLKIWRQHSLQRNALSRAKPYELQALSSLHPDLKARPDIKVYVDPFYGTSTVSTEQKDTSQDDLTAEEHVRLVSDFTKRAGEHNYFNNAVQSTHPYLAPSVRSVLDQEKANIEQSMAQASKDNSRSLPPSLSDLTFGKGRHQPLLSMHAVLDMLVSLPSPTINRKENVVETNNSLGALEDNQVGAAFLLDVNEIKPRFAGEVGIEPVSVREAPEAKSVKSGDAKIAPPSPTSLLSAESSPQSHRGPNAIPFAKVEETVERKASVAGPPPSVVSDEGRIEDPGHRFLESSRVLSQNEEERKNLYYCLPFFARTPALHLIYSTFLQPRSLEELYSSTMRNRTPVILLIRSGEFRFGAYLSHSPSPSCCWQGTPACFLFSLTLNLKVPYHARQSTAENALREPMALYGQDDRLFIGNGDLTIDGNLKSGTSEVENSYGLGLEPQSQEAMCLLGGSPAFHIDDLEVWSISAK